MSVGTVRKALLAIWFTCFGISLAIVLYLGLGKWIEQDNFHRALTQLNSSYVPYLGVITAFYFASTDVDGTVKENNVAATLALVASLLWNASILALFIPLLFGHGVIEEAVKDTEFVGGLISWLVAPAIGFYFARKQDH